MKNTILIFFSFIFLSGCIGTADYYQSKTEFYVAQATATQAYIQAVSKPIAEMTAPDGTRFVVNNHNIPAPRIEQANSPIVDGLKVILQSTPAAILSGGWAGSEIIKHSTGQLTNTGGGTINTNSGNPQLQSEAGIDQSEVITTEDNSATAPPLVVTQPAPTVVNPLVVETKPEIVKPEVIRNEEAL